jgi:type II secretory pathway pseudopilin PulG
MISCPKCGLAMPETNRFCAACGADVNPGATAMAPMASAPASAPETSGKAIASLVLGICVFVLGFFTGIPAIVFGHLAKSDIKKSGGRLQGEGLALAGLILGYLSVVFIPFILIIAAIAIPNLLRAKMAANEAAAVGSLRTVMAAAVNYNSAYGQGFPESLNLLGPAGDGSAPNAGAAGLIDADLAAGQKYGYNFTYQASSSHGDGMLDAFRLNADPVVPGSTGMRHFFLDQTGVIRYQDDGPANENSPPVE